MARDSAEGTISRAIFGWRFLGPVGVLGGSPRRAISCWLGDFGCEGSWTEVDNGLFFGSCDVFG